MKIILFLFNFTFTSLLFAQTEWQQEVNTRIQVSLNDEDHLLNGDIEIEYLNNSPDELPFIYIHLWPNAYSNRQTALAKQIYQDNNNLIHFGDDSIKGCIELLDFKVNGEKIRWHFNPKHIDIAKLYLSNPLQSGEKIIITTPFQIHIPSGEISRLGHIDQSYQITQWYPKPAVYDKNGWHPIPYLNQGEFYSEFGSFAVSITLPANYVVAATGDLQTQSEIDFLNSRAKLTSEKMSTLVGSKKNSNKFPESSQETKTIRFVQEKVHDFAWFADKRYEVLKGEIELPHSKRKVTTWAMFTPKNASKWEKAIEYLNDGTYYYSLWNGDYPYNQVTAVDGTISAGGGMEYPNVTVIGNASSAEELEIVIVHEVGHNWFYGILGSNERDHGWMDEGLNTLNEIRYIQTKYPGNTRLSDMVLNGRFHFDHLDYHDQADIQFQLISRFGEDQPIETKSEDFSSINYGLIMYQKTGLIFHYLKDYLGEKLFDECMSAYFEKWKFRHPQPEDLRAIFESKTNKNLDWFFNDLIQTTNHIDYKIKNVRVDKEGKTNITVKNVGQVNGPIPITYYNEEQSKTIWLEPGKERKKTLTVESEITKVQIDSLNNIPEINRNNNIWDDSRILKKFEPIKLQILFADNEPHSTNLIWSPIAGYNVGDQFMLGGIVHNLAVPTSPLQFYVAPMFSFGRQMISGITDFSYHFLPKKGFKMTKIGVSGRSFKLDDIRGGNNNYYVAVTPYLQMKLGNRGPQNNWTNEILAKGIYREDALIGGGQKAFGGYVDYLLDFTNVDHKWETHFKLDHYQNTTFSAEATRIHLSSTYAFRYLKKKYSRWIELRVFAGKMLSFTDNPLTYGNTRFALSGANGHQDLFFDDLFFNRIGGNTASTNLRADNYGGFRTTSSVGDAANWMTTANLFWEAPTKIQGLGIYADGGLFANESKVESAYTLGVGLRVRKIVHVFFPVVMSNNLASAYPSGNYFQRVRFTIYLNLLTHPIRINKMF